MATIPTNRFDSRDPLGLEQNRDGYIREAEAVDARVRAAINNDPDGPNPKSPEWNSEMFRIAVLRALRSIKPLQEQAEHLRIVKSVFSGRT